MFTRTSSGIKNTDLFYKNQYLVFVEGQDDIPFWKKFFPEEVSGYSRKIKLVGGKEIEKYVNEINKGNAKFAVALDSDYRLFMKKIHEHPQIVETLAYSIENLMIKPQILAKIICVESRQEDYDTKNVEEWLKYFDETMYDLMVADYLTQKECLGEKCLRDNCQEFLPKSKEPNFSREKINNAIKYLNIADDKWQLVRQELKDYKPSQHIRGHFFLSSCLCFVNSEIKKLRNAKKSITKESFYTMLFLNCETSLFICSDLKELHNKAVKAAQNVVRLLSTS